jgi:phosphate transport system permease protein
MTGTILAVSRGAGEEAPGLFTGVAFLLPNRGALPPPSAAYEQFMQLGNHVYVLSTQSPNVEETKPILYSTVLVLLALTFLLNLTAIVIRKRIRAWATI